MFLKVGVLNKFCNIYNKTPVSDSRFNKVADLRACNFFKVWLQHGVFVWILRNFQEQLFFIEHLRWLLLHCSCYSDPSPVLCYFKFFQTPVFGQPSPFHRRKKMFFNFSSKSRFLTFFYIANWKKPSRSVSYKHSKWNLPREQGK